MSTLPPPSIPPLSLEHFAEVPREADTERPPPDFATVVLLELKPYLERMESAFRSLSTWQQQIAPIVAGLSTSTGQALNKVDNAEAQVNRLADAWIGLAVEVRDLRADLDRNHRATIDAIDRLGGEVRTLCAEVTVHRELMDENYDKLGRKVATLEEHRLRQTGEDDGSITAAAIRGATHGE